jgi:Na+/H+ antiporter NhaD/arsenite permease-like protein
MLCLLFLYFESVFGICIACKFYKFFYREKVQYCPGEVCEVKSRQEIQKISPAQVLVVIAFIVLVVAAAFLLKAEFSKKPFNLFKAASSVAR